MPTAANTNAPTVNFSSVGSLDSQTRPSAVKGNINYIWAMQNNFFPYFKIYFKNRSLDPSVVGILILFDSAVFCHELQIQSLGTFHSSLLII